MSAPDLVTVPRERTIFCCTCATDVAARLTDGKEIYPHRRDLYGLPFWKCDTCSNYVGCHHKTSDRTRPLGVICGPEMKNARREIHKILDPLWQSKGLSRRSIYAHLTQTIGREYHTAEIRSLDEARTIYRAIKAMEPRR